MTEEIHRPKKLEPIDASEVADRVIETLRARWIELMAWSIVLVYSTVAVREVSSVLFRADKIALFGASYVLGFALISAITIAFVRVTFATVDGTKISIGESLAGSSSVFVRYIATSSSFSIGMLIGLLLLLVPGVVFMLVFGFAPILVIDEKLNPIAAYKRSAQITRGTRFVLLYMYGAAFLLAFMALAPWTLAPGAVGTGMFYAVATLIFCAFSVLSASVTRALQAREKGVEEERLTQDSLSV
jgi:hypothetical protein